MNGLDPTVMWTGAVLAGAGTIVAALRNLPRVAWDALVRLVTVSVEVRDQDLVKWVGITAIEKWGLASRRTAAAVHTRRDISEITLEPARGRHLLRWAGRYVIVDRGKEDQSGSSELRAMLAMETVSLRGLGRDPSWLREMLNEAMLHGKARFSKAALVRFWGGYEWLDLAVGAARPLETVILPGTIREELRETIRLFLSRPDWYYERGIPWRLGIGLFGPPGTGKSSLIRALCGEFGLPLHMVDLSRRNDTDGGLLRAMGMLGPRTAAALDDLDASLLPTRDGTPGGITLSGLLAALDGPGAGEGRVVFICSNHPEKLDPAILRDGRIDISVTLGPATEAQAKELFLRWHPRSHEEAEEFGRSGQGFTMAELQGRLLRNGSQPYGPT